MEPVVAPQPQLLGLDADGPRVVAIGGGHGLAQILMGVQSYAGQIDAVVAVSDDGGSSGRLAEPLGIPAPGDIRRCLLALTREPSVWAELLSYRFDRSDIAGHSLGNMIMAALTDIAGSFETALRLCSDLLGTNGQVHPVSVERLRLAAMKDTGYVIGQVAVSTTPGTIEHLELLPATACVNPAVLDSIVAADQIVLAPGSLFTSVISNLVVPGVAEAINRSGAPIVYVMNLVTQDAETLGMDAVAHVEALETVGGLTRSGTVLASRGPVRVPPGLEAVTVNGASVADWQVVHGDLCDDRAGWPQHDAMAVGESLGQMIGAE